MDSEYLWLPFPLQPATLFALSTPLLKYTFYNCLQSESPNNQLVTIPLMYVWLVPLTSLHNVYALGTGTRSK